MSRVHNTLLVEPVMRLIVPLQVRFMLWKLAEPDATVINRAIVVGARLEPQIVARVKVMVNMVELVLVVKILVNALDQLATRVYY